MAKLPQPPDLTRIGIRPEELRTLTTEERWWRVHRTRGPHVTRWNEMRRYGPVDARFEPHEPPTGLHDEHGVWYAAATPRTCLAEVFQRTRTVATTGSHHLISAVLRRDVAVLDITGDAGHGAWATRAGASMALSTGRHDFSSAWARAICTAFPTLDGLAYRAALDGGLALALFWPARDALPTAPVTSRALSDPALGPRLARICDEIGYRL